MPSEVRIIAFTPEDVFEAIDGFGAIADKRLFRGKVVDCHVRKHPGDFHCSGRAPERERG